MIGQTELREIVKCKKSFPYFCREYIKIYHPLRGLVPFSLYDFQEGVFEEYQENRFNIIRKFRQGGLSTMTAIYCLWQCLFFVDKSAFVISIADREAMNFHKIILRAYEYLPDWMRGEALIKNNHELVLDTGGSVQCYTPKAGRGFSKGLLIVDEAAFIPEMDDFWARVYPTISTGGKAIVISTVNGIGNWYHQTWIKAENNTNKFHPIHLDYMEHPDYKDPQWVEDTKVQLGDKKWRQEVLGEFLGGSETYIPGDTIKEYIDNSEEPPIRKLNDALRVWEPPKPGHMYILGCDPSEGIGEEGDFAAIQVIDVCNLHQVAEFYSQDYPPNKYSQIVASIGRQYNTAAVVVENNKMGVAVLDDLQNEICYENIYFSSPQGGSSKKPKMGWNQNVKTRPMVQESLFHILTSKIATIRSLRLANELQTWIFNSRNQKAEHLRGYYDDALMALGIALVTREEILRNSSPMFDLLGEQMNSDEEIVSTYIKDESLIGEIAGATGVYDADPLEPLMPGVYYSRPNEDLLKEFGW